MNSVKLAEENAAEVSRPKKVLLAVVNGQWPRKTYFDHCFTGWNSLHRLHLDQQAGDSDFQISASCAYLIKMKTHFQFTLINWNIVLTKLVTDNIADG